MQQFAGGTPEPKAAEEFHERFISRDENDRAFDNDTYHAAASDHLGQLPDDNFEQAARSAIDHAPPEQRADLLGTLMSALGGAGAGGALGALGGAGGAGAIGQIAQMLGLGTSDPRRMSPGDAAKLMNYARKEQPGALRQTVAEQPWFVKAMGNPVLMGALAMAASRLLSRRR